MNPAAPSEDTAPGAAHLYDAVAAQKDQIVGDFAAQREALVRAVEEQRLAAMPQHMQLAAMSPAQVSAEIAQTLRQLIAREVTRQLQLAVSAMLASKNVKQTEEVRSEEKEVAQS